MVVYPYGEWQSLHLLISVVFRPSSTMVLDGSRMEGRAARATRGAGVYLGMVAAVAGAGAEEAGVALAWEKCIR